jgi:hypothetical protein
MHEAVKAVRHRLVELFELYTRDSLAGGYEERRIEGVAAVAGGLREVPLQGEDSRGVVRAGDLNPLAASLHGRRYHHHAAARWISHIGGPNLLHMCGRQANRVGSFIALRAPSLLARLVNVAAAL